MDQCLQAAIGDLIRACHQVGSHHPVSHSLRSWWFEQTAWQVAMAVHCAAHDHIIARHFVEEDVLFERAENNEESPVAKPRVIEAAARPKQRMLSEKLAGGLHGSKIMLGHIPACLRRIPLKLLLNVRDEIAGLEDAHG
jgi:hypothetical protein